MLKYIFPLWFIFTAQSYYVAPGGNNSNPGSISQPWKSLEHAVTRAVAGDTIFMRGGTYLMNEVFIDRKKGRGGASGQYLTIKNFLGEQPVLKYGSRRLIIWADYVRVEGLHLEMPWRCDAFGRGIQIVGNKFTGPQPKFGAIETGGTNILIEDNFIQLSSNGNTRDHGIYVHAGNNITIRGNTVIGSQGYGIHIYDEHKSTSPVESLFLKNYIIEGNAVSGSKLRSGIIIAGGQTRNGKPVIIQDIKLHNNIIFKNAIAGLLIRKGDNIEVYNNTFYSNHQVDIWNSGAKNVSVVNNIFEGAQYHVANQSRFGMEVKTNLYYPTLKIEGVNEQDPVVTDPLFVNSANSNFNLQGSSPAIDRGILVGLPFNGNDPDLGALEFGGVVVPPECADGIDNDGDGLTDFPADPGCESAFDDNEIDVIIPPDDSTGVDEPPVTEVDTLRYPLEGKLLKLVFDANENKIIVIRERRK